MDIQTLDYVIEQIGLINKPEISAEDLKRYIANLQNNLEQEIERQEAIMLEQMYENIQDGIGEGQFL